MKRLFALLLVPAFAFATQFATPFAIPTNLFAQEKQQEENFFKAFPAMVVSEANKLVKELDELDFGPISGIGMSLNRLESTPETIEVVSVFEGRPASLAGIQAGDVILTVNGKRPATLDEFVKEVRGDNSPGRTVTLELDRKGVKVTATMVTVIIRDDRTAEAKRLRETIVREGEAMLAKLKTAFAEAAKAVDAGQLKENEPRIKAALDAVDEYYSWYAARSKDIDKLLELK